jgi:hypothetical protein
MLQKAIFWLPPVFLEVSLEVTEAGRDKGQTEHEKYLIA